MEKCFWSANCLSNWPLLWACQGTYGASVFLLDTLVRKGDINHLWVYESQYIHFSCHKTLEILIQTRQWYETQLIASFIVKQDIMGCKWFMGWLNDGHGCSGFSNSLKRHFSGKLSRLKRKLPRSQELEHCVVRFKEKQKALAGPSCSLDSTREQHDMKTDKQAGWPVSPESREKNQYVLIKTFPQNQKVFFLWKVFSGSSYSARPLNLSYVPSLFSQQK